MPLSRQAFSAPSKPMPASNPKGDLSSIASISVSLTISIPSSEPSVSRPRDSAPKREQNPRYRHDNGLIPSRQHAVDLLLARRHMIEARIEVAREYVHVVGEQMRVQDLRQPFEADQ